MWWKNILEFIFPDVDDIGWSPKTQLLLDKTKASAQKMQYRLDHGRSMVDLHYKPKYFQTEELVDPYTFAHKGEAALGTMDVRILITADNIREYFGRVMTINNWHIGGEREWSGLRTKDSTYYSPYSQHSFGRAIDFLIKGLDAQEVRDRIKADQNHKAFQYITRMENYPTMSWIHVDCMNWNRENGIYVFKP